MTIQLGVQLETLNAPLPTADIYASFKTHATVHWCVPFPLSPGQFWVDGVISDIVGLRNGDPNLDIRLHVMPPKQSGWFWLPSSLSDWRYWLLQLAAQLHDTTPGHTDYGVVEFSIGNEFNPGGWVGTPNNTNAQKITDYQTLIAWAYDGLKTGNPTCVVLDDNMAGSTYGISAAKWYWDQGLYDQALWFIQNCWYQNPPLGRQYIPQTTSDLGTLLGTTYATNILDWSNAHFTTLAPYFDDFGLHYYQNYLTMQNVFDFLAAKQAAYGLSKGIKFYECGYAWTMANPPLDWYEAARSDVKQAVIAMANGVSFINHFPIFTAGTIFKGLAASTTPQTLTPAGIAWGLLSGFVNGATFQSKVDTGDPAVSVYKFGGAKVTTYVMWATGNTYANLKGEHTANSWTVTDMNGSVQQVFSSRIAVSPSPVFVQLNAARSSGGLGFGDRGAVMGISDSSGNLAASDARKG